MALSATPPPGHGIHQPVLWLRTGQWAWHLPHPTDTLHEPDGLLAAGGDLSTARLLSAYRQGIFPWYAEAGGPILWWSPRFRCVLFPKQLHISRRLQRHIRNAGFDCSRNQAFDEVIKACARGGPRACAGNWLDADMVHAYSRLHREGYAHSIEVWHNGQLAGGLYGLWLGQVFYGESMFSHKSGASQTALRWFIHRHAGASLRLIDCQIPSAHLSTLGACMLPRTVFLGLLQKLTPPQATALL